MSEVPKKIPNVVFKTRTEGAWKSLSTNDIFGGKKVVAFSLPGAFTPTCSSTHLPGYEEKYDELKALGVDEVYCISVNDSFVMNAWAKDQGIKKIKMVPDGTGEFTDKMNMLVKKDNLGFGKRSWRYSMFVDDNEIKKAFIEPGFSDDCPTDPFEVSDADNMIKYLKESKN
jgi:thioredoxin-dependent peroxiredoxin